ncbi:penicillin-binding protein activator [Oceanimonas sp. CHS3-5]|uniref:penicillin-binding protein activator n=1 Tax=Oceanimonas sp. CHS3-5 TaxID=3068186 RepID=UPI00273EBE9A|nr:penicillin-binding protein activator [Oceanimonas sp. CHS3-5]MDP5293126.1 penicillin-binding protein activator [Oceanimonas sp. CHS3-5]
MATQIQWTSVTRLLCTLVLSSALMACGSGLLQPAVVPEPAPDMFSPLDRPAEQYSAQAGVAGGNDAFAWQVLSVRALLQQGNVAEARDRLNSLRPGASLSQQPVLVLLDAAVLLTELQPGPSLQRLRAIDAQRLAPSARAYLWLLEANIYEQQQQPLQAAQALIARHGLLAGPAQNNNRERIYRLLARVPAAELRRAQSENNSPEANGWFRLMAILNTAEQPAAQRNWQLQSWSRSYPDHAGRAYLPDTQATAQQQAFAPSHIAVMLPLSGRLAEQGDAIRNGILGAGQGQSARVSFFDTQGADMASLYQQAVQSGADFILGPLLKDKVDALLKQDPAMPVLALNQPAYQPELAAFYYFSLSPEGEAADAARRMWDDGHQQPLVFAPANELGRRVAAEFDRQWQAHSGRPAILAYFSDQAGIEQDVRRALNSRPAAAGQVLPVNGEPGLVPEARPADAVFMVTNAAETRFILPYFDFVRDSRAERLPTYVISRSYIPAGEAPMGELAGLRLADMPWMFEGSPQLKEEVLSLWPDANTGWLRLFALGYDARAMISQLPALRQGAPAVPGLTGELTVTPEGVVQRRLQWREYVNGDWLSIGQQIGQQ